MAVATTEGGMHVESHLWKRRVVLSTALAVLVVSGVIALLAKIQNDTMNDPNYNLSPGTLQQHYGELGQVLKSDESPFSEVVSLRAVDFTQAAFDATVVGVSDVA